MASKGEKGGTRAKGAKKATPRNRSARKTAAKTAAKSEEAASAQPKQSAKGTVRLRLRRSVSRGGKFYGPGEVDVPTKLAKSLILSGAEEV